MDEISSRQNKVTLIYFQLLDGILLLLVRPATITKESMREALLELTANNRPTPSLRRLRRHLGSGSLTTISRLRDEVAIESLKSGDNHPGITGNPVATKCDEHYRFMLSAIQLEVAQAADEQIAETEKLSAQQVTAAEQRRDKVLHTRDLLNQRADKAELAFKKSEKELYALRDKNMELMSEVEAGISELTVTNAKLTELNQQLRQSAEQVAGVRNNIPTTTRVRSTGIAGSSRIQPVGINKM